jgi:hypothetical protein
MPTGPSPPFLCPLVSTKVPSCPDPKHRSRIRNLNIFTYLARDQDDSS